MEERMEKTSLGCRVSEATALTSDDIGGV